MSKKEAILITGTAGFIGFHVAHELLREGRTVVGVDSFNNYYQPAVKDARSAILHKYPSFIERRADICDIEELEHVFREFKITRICHLAAQAGVRYSLTHPMAYETANLAGFLNILEMARHSEVPRLVYASSSSVYGGNTKIPFSESDPVDNPVSLYAATKKSNELMAHCYSHLYKFQTVGLRFFTVYGPWGRPDMAMWIFTEAIKNGKPIKVFNHGKMKRDFTFVADIVKGVCASLFAEGLDRYEIFNLGNNRSEDLMHMIAVLEKSLGRQAVKQMMDLQPGDVPETCADVEKARLKLGFEPTTPIEEGIPAFVEWYNKHSDLTDLVAKTRANYTS